MTFNQVSPASDPLDATAGLGTKDGRGCGDHDQPYTFGRRPRGVAPFPFTVYQYMRLLALRGRIGDGLLGSDDLDAAGFAAELVQPETRREAENKPRLRKTPENAR